MSIVTIHGYHWNLSILQKHWWIPTKLYARMRLFERPYACSLFRRCYVRQTSIDWALPPPNPRFPSILLLLQRKHVTCYMLNQILNMISKSDCTSKRTFLAINSKCIDPPRTDTIQQQGAQHNLSVFLYFLQDVQLAIQLPWKIHRFSSSRTYFFSEIWSSFDRNKWKVLKERVDE